MGTADRGRILPQGDVVESARSHGPRSDASGESSIIKGRAFWSYLRFFLYLFYYFEAGLFLIVAPWSEGWEQSLWLLRSPRLGRWLLSGYVRGGLSGLGVIHVAWGVVEALGAARASAARSVGLGG